jgi:hypothetical protein
MNRKPLNISLLSIHSYAVHPLSEERHHQMLAIILT